MLRLWSRKPPSPLIAHCQTVLTTLQHTVNLGTIASAHQLAQVIARQRQKALAIIPYALPSSIDGAWLDMLLPLDSDQALPIDVILLANDATATEHDQVLYHELAHMLLGHSAAVGRAEWERLFPYTDLDVLFADPTLIFSALCRSRYDTVCEQEAETLATLIASEIKVLPHEADTVVAPWIGVFDRAVLYHQPSAAGGAASTPAVLW